MAEPLEGLYKLQRKDITQAAANFADAQKRGSGCRNEGWVQNYAKDDADF